MADQSQGKAFPKWKYPADGSAGKVVQKRPKRLLSVQAGLTSLRRLSSLRDNSP